MMKGIPTVLESLSNVETTNMGMGGWFGSILEKRNESASQPQQKQTKLNFRIMSA
jgi:hypothetical protein